MPDTSNFSALYPYIRTLLGDIFSVPMYSNDQLDMGIRMGTLDEYPTFVASEVTTEFTPAVSIPQDKLRLSVKAALALLRPAAGEGSYRTPMLSVSNKNNIGYMDLKILLKELTDGGINIVLGDNEFDQAFNGITTVPMLLGRFGIVGGVLSNWNNWQSL